MEAIKGYEGLYSATEDGNIYSHITGRYLKTSTNRYGYLKVNLSKDKHKKTYPVHRLIADTFLENPDNLPCINHKSEDKTDNSVKNLEYCSYAYNNAYGTRLQRMMKPVYCHDNDTVYTSIKDAADSLGLDPSKIVKVCKGIKHKTGGLHFSYEEDHENGTY